MSTIAQINHLGIQGGPENGYPVLFLG